MIYNLLKPLIWKIDPEKAHELVIKLLKLNFLSEYTLDDTELLNVKLCNQTFPTPVGLAAGFDKNFEVFDKMFNLGFGFVEGGTVTPLPQSGNPKPRIFRLIEDEALINRLGFNNDGLEIIKKNIINKLDRFKPNKLGVNIGPNKDSHNRISDYIECYKSLAKYSDYITINISSPNTPNLRNFENSEIDDLLSEINLNKKNEKNIFIKLSPDLDVKTFEKTLDKILSYKMNGIILTNTTISRNNNLTSSLSTEEGGLSGKPLTRTSLERISLAYKLVGSDIPIIGVGGIFNSNDAIDKIKAGASAIQIYTGLIYKGPGIARDINKGISEYLKRNGMTNVMQLIGTSH